MNSNLYWTTMADKFSYDEFPGIVFRNPVGLVIDVTANLQKNAPGKHDQSTHGGKKNPSRVPAGIDIRGKRFSALEKKTAYEALALSQDGNYLIEEASKVVNPATGELALENEMTKVKTLMALGSSDFRESDIVGDGSQLSKLEEIDSYNPIPTDGVELTQKQVFDTANADYKEMIAKSEPAIIVPQETLGKILNDGKVKSIYETERNAFVEAEGFDGEIDPEAQRIYNTYMGSRPVYENLAFGYTNDTDPALRPISGTLLNAGTKDDTVFTYGGFESALIVLKPETRNRTTITQQDSLNVFDTPKPLDAPNYPWSAINPTTKNAAYNREVVGDNWFLNPDSPFDPEIQVHGGVNVSDIERVVINGFDPQITRQQLVVDQLNANGIAYEIQD